MVRTKNLEQFNRYVVDLWKYLKQVFKEDQKIKRVLNRALLTHRDMDKIQYLEYTLNNITPYIDFISRKDEFIFTPEFGKKPLKFLIGVDFRHIWKSTLTSENKRIIFRYLEFLFMQASRALDKNENKVKEIKEAIIMEQEIEKEAAENPDMFGDQNNGVGGLGDLASLFQGDNILMELANDLKDELNLEELMGQLLGGNEMQPGANPMDMMKNLSENPNMQNILNSLQEKVTSKMAEKNIKPEDLLADANKLRNGLMNNVSSMPGVSQIKKMMKNLDFENLASQFDTDGPETTPQEFISKVLSNPDDSENTDFNQPNIEMPAEFQKFMEQMQSNMTNQGNSEIDLNSFLQQAQQISTNLGTLEEVKDVEEKQENQ